MPTLGITFVLCLEKTLNANFLTGSLCDVEDYSTGVCFTTTYNIYTREIKIKKTNKKQADNRQDMVPVLPVSPKVGLGNNFRMLNIYDVISQVSQIKLTI